MKKAFLTEIHYPLDQKEIPNQFLQLYQEALLLAAKEVGIIDESQYLQCIQMFEDNAEL